MTLWDRLLERDELAELDAGARRLAIRSLVLAHGGTASDVQALADTVDGFGVLTPLMRDPAVTDILVNGPSDIWVERDGRLEPEPISFPDAAALRGFVERLLAGSGRRADASQPVADGHLEDGSRIHVVMPPVAPEGPLVSIRRFALARPTLDELSRGGMFDAAERELLSAAVAARHSIVVSGATGTGKTTLVRALLGLVPPDQRVVVLEETRELGRAAANSVSLTTRETNVEGAGGISLADLVRAALRMRPDRIVVGEVRGPEALAALAAFATGHGGSMITVHARSPAEAVERLVMLALQDARAPSEQTVRRQVAAAFDLMVQLERTADGRRVMTKTTSCSDACSGGV